MLGISGTVALYKWLPHDVRLPRSHFVYTCLCYTLILVTFFDGVILEIERGRESDYITH